LDNTGKVFVFFFQTLRGNADRTSPGRLAKQKDLLVSTGLPIILI
jgi:hypothetical protein